MFRTGSQTPSGSENPVRRGVKCFGRGCKPRPAVSPAVRTPSGSEEFHEFINYYK